MMLLAPKPKQTKQTKTTTTDHCRYILRPGSQLSPVSRIFFFSAGTFRFESHLHDFTGFHTCLTGAPRGPVGTCALDDGQAAAETSQWLSPGRDFCPSQQPGSVVMQSVSGAASVLPHDTSHCLLLRLASWPLVAWLLSGRKSSPLPGAVARNASPFNWSEHIPCLSLSAAEAGRARGCSCFLSYLIKKKG